MNSQIRTEDKGSNKDMTQDYKKKALFNKTNNDINPQPGGGRSSTKMSLNQSRDLSPQSQITQRLRLQTFHTITVCWHRSELCQVLYLQARMGNWKHLINEGSSGETGKRDKPTQRGTHLRSKRGSALSTGGGALGFK